MQFIRFRQRVNDDSEQNCRSTIASHRHSIVTHNMEDCGEFCLRDKIIEVPQVLRTVVTAIEVHECVSMEELLHMKCDCCQRQRMEYIESKEKKSSLLSSKHMQTPHSVTYMNLLQLCTRHGSRKSNETNSEQYCMSCAAHHFQLSENAQAAGSERLIQGQYIATVWG